MNKEQRLSENLRNHEKEVKEQIGLKKCKKCKKEISAFSKNCPHCGCPYPHKNMQTGLIWCLVLFILCIGSCVMWTNILSDIDSDTNEITVKSEKDKANVIYFNNNKDEIIRYIIELINKKNWKVAHLQVEKYKATNDSDLLMLKRKIDKVLNKAKTKQKAIEDKRQAKIESQFSPWNGSHRKLNETIMPYLTDPKSYEHIETVYWDRKNHIIVRTTFRSKNGFGGFVRNCVMAKVTLDGRVEEYWQVE